MFDLGNATRTRVLNTFEENLQKARDVRKHYVGDGGLVGTAFRAGAPAAPLALGSVSKVNQHYWKHGTASLDGKMQRLTKYPNPMFTSYEIDSCTLHYGTDPLCGFHLAAAVVPLESGPPLKTKPAQVTGLQSVVDTAQLQFEEWT